MHEKRFDEAWAVFRKHGASNGFKERLARASETTHPREALETYAERVDQLATVGGNPAYAEAVALVARMAALRNGAEQAAYLAALKARFGRKRCGAERTVPRRSSAGNGGECSGERPGCGACAAPFR